MTPEARIAKAVGRLAAGVRVIGIRTDDQRRAERNGDRPERLEAAARELERAADRLWKTL